MAQRVETFTVTCPPNTPLAAPLETACKFNPGVVTELEIVIADGHAGTTGIAFALAHQIIIPNTRGGFVTSNDEIIRWPLDGFPNTGAWSAFTFNLDVTNAHSWYLRFLIDEIPLTTVAAAPAPLDLAAVYAAAPQPAPLEGPQ